MPQTVLVEQYWSEITSGLAKRHLPVRAFTLDVGREEHERRIVADQDGVEAADWRRQRRPDFDAALPWLRAATQVVDTTVLSPTEVAHAITRALDGGR